MSQDASTTVTLSDLLRDLTITIRNGVVKVQDRQEAWYATESEWEAALQELEDETWRPEVDEQDEIVETALSLAYEDLCDQVGALIGSPKHRRLESQYLRGK